jgi:hypothetical protein
MTENWTQTLDYHFTKEVPPNIGFMADLFGALANRLVGEGHMPGDTLTALMNVTVSVALTTADNYQIKRGEVMMMLAHYFMDAAKQHAPERFQ